MSSENTKFDELAKKLYTLYREVKGWEHWERIKRKERDYWRALAETYEGEMSNG